MSIVDTWDEATLRAPESWPGELGERLRYHLAELARQAAVEPIDPMTWETMGIDEKSHVLDVGCGAGQTLRHLAFRHPASLTGADLDADALALGARLHPEIQFVRASSEALPFRDEQFTHVVSRDALTFMHQRRALTEMRRVLEVGGFLYLYVEGPAYDLRLLRASPNFRAAICRVRDFGYGTLLHFTGRQPTPGGGWRCGRAFGTAGRIATVLRELGFTLVEIKNDGRFSTFPAKVEVIARRDYNY